jgi:hypothetical protein
MPVSCRKGKELLDLPDLRTRGAHAHEDRGGAPVKQAQGVLGITGASIFGAGVAAGRHFTAAGFGADLPPPEAR